MYVIRFLGKFVLAQLHGLSHSNQDLTKVTGQAIRYGNSPSKELNFLWCHYNDPIQKSC